MNQPIVLALPKGRIFSKVQGLLSLAGIELDEKSISSRKLIIPTNHSNLSITIVRNIDAPVYTSLGATDASILGQDSISEYGDKYNLYDLLDLQVAKCKLMTAAPKEYIRKKRRIRVATKFVYIARQYYAKIGIQADIIKLNGSVELAVAIGLADEIVDLVETGKTLAENNLAPMETIMNISSHLVVNRNSMATKNSSIIELTNILRKAIDTKN